MPATAVAALARKILFARSQTPASVAAATRGLKRTVSATARWNLNTAVTALVAKKAPTLVPPLLQRLQLAFGQEVRPRRSSQLQLPRPRQQLLEQPPLRSQHSRRHRSRRQLQSRLVETQPRATTIPTT